MMRHKFQWTMCEMCNQKKVLVPENTCSDCAHLDVSQWEILDDLGLWELVGNNVVYHRFYECSFLIACEFGNLTAKSIYVRNPDQLATETFEAIEGAAVFGFLACSGLVAELPSRKKRVKGRIPRPN